MIKDQEMKSFNLRLPKDIWLYLKKESIDKETSMTDIILHCIEKHKKTQKSC